MRLATWNVNDLGKRLPLLLAWLEATRPDVVALQELKTTDDRFPRDALEQAGYGSLVVGQRTWNGVALLARDAEPVQVRRSLPGDPKDSQARLSRLRSAASSSRRSTCRTATRGPGRSSTTRWRGSGGSWRTRRSCGIADTRWR